MFEVQVTQRFAAQHQLLMPDGFLEPLHEHDWRVTVTVAGPQLDAHGLLVDFGVLNAALREILDVWRGHNLNMAAAFAGRNPSAEHVAQYVAQQLTPHVAAPVTLRCVEVEEEVDCIARHYPAAGRH